MKKVGINSFEVQMSQKAQKPNVWAAFQASKTSNFANFSELMFNFSTEESLKLWIKRMPREKMIESNSQQTKANQYWKR